MQEADGMQPTTRARRSLLTRVRMFLEYLVMGTLLLWLSVAFVTINMDIAHHASGDTLAAVGKLVLELLGLALLSVLLAEDPQILRRVPRAVAALILSLFLLASLYDTVAHLLPGHRLSTLTELAPGPASVVEAVAPALPFVWIALLVTAGIGGLLRQRRRRRRRH